jgi:O-antigen biosynthesis protein
MLFRARSLIWRLKTHLNKALIGWEDRLGGPDYQAWLKARQPASAFLEIQRQQWSELALQPLFTILLTGSNLNRARETLQSLTANSYPDWEICWLLEVADPAYPEASRLVQQDSRLRLIDLELLPGPDANILFGAVKGDYLARLEAGDLLAPHALYTLAEAISQGSLPDIVYFDEDQRTPDGLSSTRPFLKPGWSPDLLLSVNYLKRAFFRTASLLEAVSGTVNYEELVYSLGWGKPAVIHLPHILCHALAEPVRPLLDDGSLNAIEASLVKRGLNRVQASVEAGQVRVSWAVPETLITIVILTKDKASYLRRCVDSLFELTAYRHFELVIIDNGSREPAAQSYLEQLRGCPQVRVIENSGPFNFNAFNNQGASHARGEVLLFLNNDIEAIEPGWLEEMLRWALRPEVGVVGAKLLYPDCSIQHAGVIMGMEGHASHVFYGMAEGAGTPFGSDFWYRNLSAVTGACLMVRREHFEKLGGFDEEYLLVFSDIEFCLRSLRAGCRVVFTPYARLIHHEGQTRGRHIPSGDIRLAYEHFKEWIALGDPYYNPNLSRAVCRPTLRRSGEPDPLHRLEKIVSYTR